MGKTPSKYLDTLTLNSSWFQYIYTLFISLAKNGVTKVVEKGINTSAKERQSRTCEHFYSMDFDVKKSFAKYVLKFTSMF